MLEPELQDVTETEVSRSFGEEFAAAVKGLPAGEWRGPVSSGTVPTSSSSPSGG